MLDTSANLKTERCSVAKDIAGQCDAIQMIRNHINQVAPTDCTVLVIGEPGVGKSLVARRIYELGLRNKRPLIHLSCATLAETGIEAELFGMHKKALSGHGQLCLDHLRALSGATLLLDQIEALTKEQQAYLLEALEAIERQVDSAGGREINLRLIVTAGHDLKRLVEKKQFNERLYYHLSVLTIRIPPLRERGKDILEIAHNLLQEVTDRYRKEPLYFSGCAVSAIQGCQWPGNYRELNNAIERAVVICGSKKITAHMLMLDQHMGQANDDSPLSGVDEKLAEPSRGNASEDLSLEDYFQHFVLGHQGSMTETELAQKLGISRKCLWERRQKYGIPKRKGAPLTE